MPPPLFGDLARPCMGIFNAGYPIGIIKADYSIKTPGNVNLSLGGAVKTEDWSMGSGELQTKYTLDPEWTKTTIWESWNIDNQLKVGVTVEDLMGALPGLRLSTVGTLEPETGKSSGKMNAQMKISHLAAECNFELGDETPTSVVASAVTGYNGFLFGAKGNYNLDDGKFDATTLAAAYCSNEFQVHGFLDDMEVARVCMYHRISDQVEAGAMVGWKPGEGGGEGDDKENNNTFSIGARMLITPFTFFRAKLNIQSEVGLGIESKLREGVTLTAATLLNGKNLSGGEHKFGLGLEFNSNFGC